MTRRIVVFGGTFDPVQAGHMVVADAAYRALQPQEFWFVVANIPGERKPVYASAAARLEMVQAAIAGDPRFVAVDMEIKRGGVTYTEETMEVLHREFPDTRFELLLGADSARTIRAWRYGDELLAQEWFVIVNREGEAPLTVVEAEAIGYGPERVRLIEIASPAISSSEVRRRVAVGAPLDDLVPAAVAAIIRRERLYAPPPERA